MRVAIPFALVACLQGAAAAQPADPTIRIPNYWDPAVERTTAPQIEGIRFITSDDFPPFNFLDGNDRLVGFNVDLARAICDALMVPCTIQSRPFDDLVAALEEGRADAAIAGIAVTADTRRSVAFTETYLRLPARFVTRTDDPMAITAETMAGREVAVVARTAHEAYLSAFFGDVAIVAYETAAEARAALRDREVDALFGDGMQLAFWLESDDAAGCCAFAGGPYLEPAFFGQGLAIAVRPDAPNILAAVNAALRTVHANGTFASLYLRYFPIGFY